MTQNELLDQLETDLRRVLDQVRTQIVPLEEELVQYRPDSLRWNVLECFAHLNAFSELYLSRIEAGIHKAKARKWIVPANEIKYTSTARRDIRRVDSTNEQPRKSKKRYNYYQQPLGKDVVKTFIINCERLLRNLHLARETDLNRPKIGRGPSGFFKYTLGNTLEWLVRHDQRHLRQAQTLLSQMQGKGLA